VFALLAVVHAAPAAADDAGPGLHTPWSPNFEVPLRDTVAPWLRANAARMLNLTPDETAVLEEILRAHADRWSQFEARARPIKREADEALTSAWRTAPGDVVDARAAREQVLAPLADEQSAIEADLLEAVRTRCAEARTAEWWRLRHALDRVRHRNAAGGLPTNAPDVIAIAARVTGRTPSAVHDMDSLGAILAAHAERTVGTTATIRQADVGFSRGMHRWMAAARRAPAPDPSGGPRAPNDAHARRTMELMERRSRAVLEQARLNLATLKAIEALLDEPARTELQRDFWRGVAEACNVTWWPVDMDGFREEVTAAAPEETRDALGRHFAAAWAGALGRIMALEARVRGELAGGANASARVHERVADMTRAADEAERAALQRACEDALALLPASAHAGVRVPTFKPMPRMAPPS
jgi:hypothetical protein